MCNVVLNDGSIIESYFVFFQSPPQLHIYPVNMTIGEIYETFDNPEATKVITVNAETVNRETGEKTIESKAYQGFTELFAVQRSPFHPTEKEYLVWMQRPAEIE